MVELKDPLLPRSPPPARLRQHITRPRLLVIAALFLCIALYLSYPLTSFTTFANEAPTPFPDFSTPYSYPSAPHAHVLEQKPKRVAIIGAGASGSSAAWFLSRAAGVIADRLDVEKEKVLAEIVVFDREDRPGGRTTTVHPYGNTSLRAVELGGSIFVRANRHMNKAVKRFGLETSDPDIGEAGIGIWDGQQFLFQTPASSSRWSDWLASTLVVRRYGPLSPLRTKKAVATLLQRFANLYHPTWLAEHGAAASVEDFSERVGLGMEYVTRKGDEWARKLVGVNERWLGEIWGASTRVNYAANMDQIHALGAAVSMAADGGKSVKGGNWQIFQGMLHESGATEMLGVEVVDIVPSDTEDGRKFVIRTNDSADHGTFDQIFYATPWLSSPKDRGLRSLQQHLTKPISYTPYVRLHVTYMTTTSPYPHPSFFSLRNNTVLPSTILTSAMTSQQNRQDPTPPPMFQSISWSGETYPGSGEWVVKIFSKSFLNDRILRSIADETPGWVLRKEWDAYPVLKPLSHYPPVEPVKGVQYLAALEPWVSTMETQTLSAREAVARVVDDWWGLGYGECEGGADAWDWSCEQ